MANNGEIDVLTLGAARNYTKQSMAGGGAVKGAPCQISGITDNADGTHTVTFSWKDNAGANHTSNMTIKDGKDGENGTDGLGIKSGVVDADNHLIVTFDDDTTQDWGEIATVKGDKGDKGDDGEAGEDGFSPSIEVKESTAEKYVLTVTNKDGSYDTPNLKGGGSGSASNLSELEDVVLTSLKTGQILKYNATVGKWYNADGIEIESLGDIADVNLSSLADGQVIAWNATTEKWENVDVANPMQFETMPTAKDYPQAIIQFIGADTANYKRGYFYRSTPAVVSGELVYSWAQTDTQPSNRDYEDLDNTPQINGIDLKGDKTSTQLGLQGQIQYAELPTPTVSIAGAIVQYIGSTTADYKAGYFYQCAYNSETTAYEWVQKDVSDNAALLAAVRTLQTNQGDMSTLEVGGVSTLVAAINALNNKDLKAITYAEPILTITYKNGETYDFNIKSILNETQIGELEDVIDTTIANGNVLQYDSSILKYKPYDILSALSNLLAESKEYTDNAVQSSVQVTALVCDEKPSYDSVNDTVVYKQNGEIKTTTQTDTRFYYEDAEGDPYCTSWIDDIEFTYSVSDSKFSDYINKNTDITSTYTEDMANKAKVPNVGALDALLAIVKDLLAAKVNTDDIVDGLTSQDATKVLSAKQGKVLSDLITAKQDVMQYATMPSADSSIAGRVVQYVGSSSGAYTSGYFYKCVYDNESDIYVWAVVKYSADTDAALDENSENPVQNKVIKGALDEKQNSTMSVPIEINGTQYTTVESAIGAILALANLKQAKTLDTPVAVDGTNYTTVETALGALAGKTVDVDGSTIAKDEDTGALSAVKATNTTYGIVKPDNDTIRINEEGELEGSNTLEQGVGITIENNVISANTNTYRGTKAAWDELTTAEKVKYTDVDFTDYTYDADDIEERVANLEESDSATVADAVIVQKAGKVVCLHTVTTGGDSYSCAAQKWVTVCTLAKKYIPSHRVGFAITAPNGQGYGIGYVDIQGDVMVHTQSEVFNCFNVSWIVA